MSVELRPVQWNTHKRVYDAAVTVFILLSIGTIVIVGLVVFPSPSEISPPILLMRALGGTAALMLHVILAIGPLARLTPLAAPLLYNRRHLGVAFFLVVLLHAVVATVFYGGFGQGMWLTNVVTGGYRTANVLPFEAFGFAAALIFLCMAATSHDFWLAFLGPRVWKWLHMCVYIAYALVVIHVLLGAAAERATPAWPGLLGLGVVLLSALHIAAAFKSLRERATEPTGDGWVDAGEVTGIPNDRARVVRLPSGAQVAVFRTGGQISAMSNVCAHQGGPIGEGKIVNGCATCPWHGYQYRPSDGCSPPPYTERIETYDVRIRNDHIEVRDQANALGSAATVASIEREHDDDG